MLKSLLIAGMVAAVAVSLSFADQTPSKLVIPVNKTAPTNGKQMYTNYCAPCHGTEGRGNGPAAGALKTQPTDLTVLSRNNHGKFPDAHVVTILQFGSETPAHGSALMPVWGPILGNMNRANIQEKQLRISNLSRYLETIQER
ncbi:MAG TPA: c-type cytochrome [Terracidiphilus sp.]|jgi:mono/diheme cytochrome c family protein